MTRTSAPASTTRDATDAARVAVSTVIFSLRRDPGDDCPRLVLPLVRRTRDPFKDLWALPGGWLDAAEGLEDAASRTLEETTALTPSYLEQLYAFGDVDRSPTRVVSIVYWALLRAEEVDSQVASHAAAGTAPENVRWFAASDLPPLAFDHDQIVGYALWRLRNKAGYSRIAHGLLAEDFTLSELREVYEAILDRRLDPANFRRQAEASGTLIPTDRFRTGSHRPARLYRYDQDVELADRGPLGVRESRTR
ncbi:NUDIX domain-containing protein [Microbacterium sp. SORGH_AS_0888]|uniref:NUDIX hydrolase n=1 Tax=Microbacterium sp. SORGH_AS_0888 TaxID=3041791 RepID=UPI0027827399|nr:NUDIX domain-containing protein [Microbacterium sp. SORGH_AS_0888]MDQ1128161.1 8-oxo-dGTP diphosphatase [Microbacterium sp. SORGH_AS_0888]